MSARRPVGENNAVVAQSPVEGGLVTMASHARIWQRAQHGQHATLQDEHEPVAVVRGLFTRRCGWCRGLGGAQWGGGGRGLERTEARRAASGEPVVRRFAGLAAQACSAVRRSSAWVGDGLHQNGTVRNSLRLAGNPLCRGMGRART